MAAADARLLKLIGGGGRRESFVSLLRDLVKAGAEDPAAGKPAKARAEKPATVKAGKKPKKAKKKKASQDPA